MMVRRTVSAELYDEIAKNEARITVIHKENDGVSSARNKGIEYFIESGVERGYIAFLDADDLWCEKVINDIVIDKIKKYDADIVGFSMFSSNEKADRFKVDNRYEERLIKFTTKHQTSFLWAHGSFAAHFYNLKLFREVKNYFNIECKQNEDVIFSAKMLFSSKSILLLSDFLYVYRSNMKSVTHSTKYNLKNAAHIPDSWKDAETSFDDAEIDANDLYLWKKFCRTTSSIRCLEMIRELALSGFPYKDIENLFKDRKYYLNIVNLSKNELAQWQQNDLESYKTDKVNFCRT